MTDEDNGKANGVDHDSSDQLKADLDKAKNVLKEAVLLPLLMPEYFKVNLF